MRVSNRFVWSVVVVFLVLGAVQLGVGIIRQDFLDIVLGFGIFSVAGLLLLGYQPWARTI